MTTPRDQLSSRTIPRITLGDGAPGSLSGPLPPLQQTDPRSRALERFAFRGNAIVTGGTGDLGLAACRALLEHGAAGLALFDVLPDAEGAARAAQLARDFPNLLAGAAGEPEAKRNVFYLRVDVTDEAAVCAAVREADARFLTAAAVGGGGGGSGSGSGYGSGGIDALVCLAGVVSTAHAADTTAAQFRAVLDVNLTGSFLCAREAARAMRSRGARGSIVLTASISGHRPNWPQPQVAYNVSKAGVLALKDSLAAEWGAHGIRVNSVSPGYMDTILNEGAGLDWHKSEWYHRHPMGRMGQPEELMGAIILLVSRAGAYITGEDIRCDGGQILMM